MSSAVLRRAAAKIRENAKAASPGTWDGHLRTETGKALVCRGLTILVSTIHAPDAVHMASWHPAVALAAAKMLDAYAQMIDDAQCDFFDGDGVDAAALAFAKAYLGEDAA